MITIARLVIAVYVVSIAAIVVVVWQRVGEWDRQNEERDRRSSTYRRR